MADETNFSGRDGAIENARRVNEFWRNKGHDAGAVACVGDDGIWIVKTLNMINGLPVKKKEK